MISNLLINRSGEDYVGLFGFASGSGSIDSLGLINVDIVGRGNVGGLVGVSTKAISYCYTTGTVRGTWWVHLQHRRTDRAASQ